ncbi:MAG: hypothetical protein EA378_10600 [Phycisphaerales bacterium]|nr:MAG: hypothetical protein EA378_10600 [Phycisphaerales bacterium]
MSTTPDPTQHEDARLTLSGLAAQGARRNRPRGPVLLAGVLLAGASLYAGVQWLSLSSEQGRVERERSRAARVLQASADLSALRAGAEEAGSESETEPISDILARLQRYGGEFGIEIPFPRDSTRDVRPGLRERRYTYTLSDASIGSILGWVAAVTDRVPGMRVYSFNLSVRQSRWQLIVEFIRLERTP